MMPEWETTSTVSCAYPQLQRPLPNAATTDGSSAVRILQRHAVAALEREETVLVVSHSGIMVAFDIVAGLKPEPVEDIWSNRSKVPNAAPVVFEYTDGKLHEELHLEPSTRQTGAPVTKL